MMRRARQIPKPIVRVRFRSPAPREKPRSGPQYWTWASSAQAVFRAPPERASRSHPWSSDRRLRGRRDEREPAWVSRLASP